MSKRLLALNLLLAAAAVVFSIQLGRTLSPSRPLPPPPALPALPARAPMKEERAPLRPALSAYEGVVASRNLFRLFGGLSG